MNIYELIKAHKDGARVETLDANDQWKKADIKCMSLSSIEKYLSIGELRIAKSKQKIDLSVLIKSGIDCEFSHRDDFSGYSSIGLLKSYGDSVTHRYTLSSDEKFIYCRPRMNHIHAWRGGDCPLPEGFYGFIYLRNGERTPLGKGLRWIQTNGPTDIIAFEVTGIAEGWEL